MERLQQNMDTSEKQRKKKTAINFVIYLPPPPSPTSGGDLRIGWKVGKPMWLKKKLVHYMVR